MSGKGRSNGAPRRGVILAIVLASLVVVMLLALALTEAVILHHRQSRLAEEQQQCFWLAESAVQRAVHALAKSPDYTGEMWSIPAETLGNGRAGRVVIHVEKAADPRPSRRVRVEAYYPDQPVHRTLQRREVVVAEE